MVLLLGFGNTSDGQLGLGGGEIEQILEPTEISLPWNEAESICGIACASHHCIILSEAGQVASCGNNDSQQLAREGPRKKLQIISHLSGLKINQVSCGINHSIILTKSGHLMNWGSNEFGQLGIGKESTKSEYPKELNLTEVVQIACGDYHCLALKRDGELYSWGKNDHGQLGLGHKNDTYQPQRINSLHGVPLCQISCGGSHSMALSSSGALFSWGLNNYGQLGVGDTNDSLFPNHVKSLRNQKVTFLSCGQLHTAALTFDGRIFTFGSNCYGQLGHGLGLGQTPTQTMPRQVLELMGSKVTSVACGRCHTMAVVNGRCYAFGLGSNGQLGFGDKENRNIPSVVKCEYNIRGVFASGDYSLAFIQNQTNHNQNISPIITGHVFPLGTILSLDFPRVKLLLEKYSTQKDKEIFEVIETVFSSLACICNSFLVSVPNNYGCTRMNLGIDLDSVKETYALLSQSNIAKELEKVIKHALEWSLIPSLNSSPPNLECLRVYLNLTFLSVFSRPENCFSLHSPFAEKFCMLKEIAQGVIANWIGNQEKRHIRLMILTFKDVITYVLKLPQDSKEYAKRQICLKNCCNWLLMMNSVNSKTQQVNYAMFYVDEIAERVDIRQEYVRWLLNKGATTFSLFNYPFLFNAEVKTMLLQTDAAVQMQLQVDEANRWNIQSLFLPIQMQSPFLSLTINRDNIVHDTISGVMSQNSLDLKKPMKVQFAGEEADDAGGVKKEFFQLLFRHLLCPDYGMFIEFEESRMLWFSTQSLEDVSMYQLVGVLFGLAIYNSVLVDVNFPMVLYKKLLKKEVTLEDFAELSPIIGRSLEQLLDYEDDDFDEVFCLTFEVQESYFGETKSIELKPGGKSIPVTKDSRAEYVKLYLEYKLDTSIRVHFDAFADGFHRAVTSHILKFFQPRELMEMSCGNEHYDWDVFKKNTEYRGEYYPGHPTIEAFWKVFREFDIHDKKKFLLFLTGSDRVPLLGMSQIKMTVQSTTDSDRYPVAHTCFNLLDLPKIDDENEMSKRLKEAIEHTQGFTLV